MKDAFGFKFTVLPFRIGCCVAGVSWVCALDSYMSFNILRFLL